MSSEDKDWPPGGKIPLNPPLKKGDFNPWKIFESKRCPKLKPILDKSDPGH
jgi:hypothetical protein